MVVPFAAYISYVDISVLPLIHVRGSTQRSDPVSTKTSVYVTLRDEKAARPWPDTICRFECRDSPFPD